MRNTLNTLGKIREHLFGNVYVDALHQVKELIDTIEVDRTRIKPIVKITGEFWAQTTEGDGNFNMFAFLEREGAQVLPEPIATWAAYLMYQGKYNHERRKAVEEHQRQLAWWNLKDRAKLELKYAGKFAGITVGESLWRYFYHRVVRELGGLTHELIPQKQLARLAAPFYNKFARGGEGHLEVGKNVYYTVNNRVHMVLALKPFGCMPSSQSDGVQSAVINKYKDMIFLPIETSGEGEVNAHSRVQMALGEAKAKARAEFEKVLESTGKRLDDIKDYVAEHSELRRPLYHVPERPGVAGTGAQFILHVSDRMDHDSRSWRRTRSSVPAHTELGVGVNTMTLHNSQYMVGLDVGSTTVKAIVAEAQTDRILWRDYQRHETKQPEKTLEFLRRIETEVGVNTENSRIFMTGSGGTGLAELIGAKFVQEVTAVSLAVERLHPEVYSVIELGGQDAKIIVFRNDDESSRKKENPFDERQVRRRHRRGDRQDQRETEDSSNRFMRSALSRGQVAQSGRQVRRVRRNRHQWPAESGNPFRRTDGFVV